MAAVTDLSTSGQNDLLLSLLTGVLLLPLATLFYFFAHSFLRYALTNWMSWRGYFWMQVLCFWTNCALGQVVIRTQVWWSKSKTEIRLQLVVFLTDKALHPMTYCASNIVCSVIFQWYYHTDGDGWQLVCSVVYIWWNSSFGMYAVVTDCSKLN